MKKTGPAKSKIKWIVAAALLTAAISAFAVCFFTLDMPMRYDYEVSLPDGDTQTLRVSLTISSPLFCKQESALIYLGDKDVNVIGYFDERGATKEAFLSDGIVAAPVPRGGKAVLVYDVSLGLPAKHGNRGSAGKDCVVFDGDQAFLFPAAFYMYDDAGIRRAVGRMGFTYNFPDEWTEIVPFSHIESPGWSDVYALSKNAFVFGRFDNILKTETGLSVYAPAGTHTETSGFAELYDYYAKLFGSALPAYSVVLLPSGALEDRVIGGAGTAVTAASFDYGLLRDWQLLSHRLFHAFFDTAAPYVEAHIPPNLWFNEGLSTYYENMSMGALPEPLKARLEVDVDRQFALIFDQYLYMRLKDPTIYSFAAMDEEQIQSEALTEFLHYTAAPLIVKLLVDESVKLGHSPEELLRFCLTEETSAIIPLLAAIELLQDKSQDFCEAYMLGTSIPPLWDLKRHQPSSRNVLEALNGMEVLMESWWKLEDSSYRVHVVTEEQLAEAMNDADGDQVAFLPPEMAERIREYCPEVYALLNDYYRQAREKGIAFDDEDLRARVLAPE